MRFKGKSALITGASEGIGFGIAEALVKEGAQVMLSARREGPLAEAAKKLGDAASYVIGDVADEAAAERMVAETVARHGALDMVVNNAGIFLPGRVGQQPTAAIDTMLGVNLRGTILVTQAAVRAMAGRRGSILLIGSATGQVPTRGASVYGATKAALLYLTQVWAMELAPAGIRVNCLCPGGTETPALDAVAAAVPGFRESALNGQLIKRFASVEEIARVALLLLDEEKGGYATGSIWNLDGGLGRG